MSTASVDVWRNPTAEEIKFGYGAEHWCSVARSDVLRSDGTLKRRIKIHGQWWNIPGSKRNAKSGRPAKAKRNSKTGPVL